MGNENDAITPDSSPEDSAVEAESKEGEKSEPSQEGEKNAPAQKQDGTTPLHKEDRFRKVYRNWKESERKVSELSERLSRLEDSGNKAVQSPADPPQWFTEAFGENPNLWKSYLDHSKSERDSIKRELREEMERESRSEKESDDASVRFIENQLDEMEDEGIEFDRNALIKFAWENPVLGEDGNIDLRRCRNLMEKIGGQKSDLKEERKKLTATGNSPAPENKATEFFTDKDFAGRGWGGLK